MPFPFVVAGAAALSAGLAILGAKKISDADKDSKAAAQLKAHTANKIQVASDALIKKRNLLKQDLANIGKLRLEIAQKDIPFMVDMIKQGGSFFNKTKAIQPYQDVFSKSDFKDCEQIAQDFASVQPTKLKQYAFVVHGAFGLDQTGSLQSNDQLNQLLNQNQTLMWVNQTPPARAHPSSGGGSINLECLLFGCLVAGPVLSIIGFVSANEAREALANAIQKDKAANKLIGDQISSIHAQANIMRKVISEQHRVLKLCRTNFAKAKAKANNSPEAFKSMLIIAREMKDILYLPVLTHSGAINQSMQDTCTNAISKLNNLRI